MKQFDAHVQSTAAFYQGLKIDSITESPDSISKAAEPIGTQTKMSKGVGGNLAI